MDWLSTEEVYKNLLRSEKEANDFLAMASKAENEGRRQMKIAEESYELHRWKVCEINEAKEELLKRTKAL